MKNKIGISIIFDQFYLEPALITAFELIQSGINYPVHLLYIESQEPSISNEIEVILSDFISSFKLDSINESIIVIKVKNTLNIFDKFHFTNAIIYKILVPSILEDFDYILNIDAGILLGEKSSDFINAIASEINNNIYNNTIIAAFCTDSKIDLISSLQHIPHNTKYPSGIMMLFNVLKYNSEYTYRNILSTWNHLSAELAYAEQDLLCIILKEGQLVQLPLVNLMVGEFLDLEGVDNNSISISEQVKEFAFYKVWGTCKPWKYWVLDFRKVFYLNRRRIFENFFPISKYEIIIRNRHQVTHHKFAEKFLEKFESNLIK